jgi:hypothetical protein
MGLGFFNGLVAPGAAKNAISCAVGTQTHRAKAKVAL